MNIPWKDAKVHEGTVPNQEDLFPKPVILQCTSCNRIGYWYPEENTVAVRSRSCQTAPKIFRDRHCWGVFSWNGNAPQEAPLTSDY